MIASNTSSQRVTAETVPQDKITTRINQYESEGFARYNHQQTPTTEAVFKYTAETNTISVFEGKGPIYHLITNIKSQPIVVVQLNGEICTGCDSNEIYTPDPGMSLNQAKQKIEHHNCIHANIANNAIKLGVDTSKENKLKSGSICPHCNDSWAFTSEQYTREIKGGAAKMVFRNIRCANCNAIRTQRKFE